MERVLKIIVGILPLVFGLAFIAPVIDQGMQAASLSAPFGLSSLSLGLIIGGVWGAIATIRGRWV